MDNEVTISKNEYEKLLAASTLLDQLKKERVEVAKRVLEIVDMGYNEYKQYSDEKIKYSNTRDFFMNIVDCFSNDLRKYLTKYFLSEAIVC